MNKTQLLQYLKRRGFSKEILYAFSEVKRENFVPSELGYRAYDNNPLPIGEGQTISQPYTIGMMLSLLDLKKGQKILEVGSGCGYVLALISKITKEKVFGIETIKELVEKSRKNLKGYNIKVYNRDGSKGLEEEAPFDKIIISAACKEIPKTLISQLKNNGIILVMMLLFFRTIRPTLQLEISKIIHLSKQ